MADRKRTLYWSRTCILFLFVHLSTSCMDDCIMCSIEGNTPSIHTTSDRPARHTSRGASKRSTPSMRRPFKASPSNRKAPGRRKELGNRIPPAGPPKRLLSTSWPPTPLPSHLSSFTQFSNLNFQSSHNFPQEDAIEQQVSVLPLGLDPHAFTYPILTLPYTPHGGRRRIVRPGGVVLGGGAGGHKRRG